jgi:Uma2 family endonuclease
VQEYIVWQLFEERIDWWELQSGRYVSLEKDAFGVIQSTAFPGLRLDVSALLAGQMTTVLAALQAPARE